MINIIIGDVTCLCQMDKDKCSYYCYRNTRDTNLVKTNKIHKIELVIFDMDGVITDTISSWKYLHDYFGTSNEQSVDAYLKGKIDDMEFIRRDANLWKKNGKPITRDMLVEILSGVPLMKGAKQCMNTIKSHGIQTAIVSAGLDLLAERAARELDMDHVFANGVKSDEDGYLTCEGILGVGLMYKDRVIRKLSKKLDIPLEHMVAVGNSCFDIPMLETCGLGVAFNPEDDCVREVADIIVEGKDLSKIFPVIEPYIS